MNIPGKGMWQIVTSMGGVGRALASIGFSLAVVSGAHAVALEGFETPALAAGTYTYTPTGSGWTFAGVTGTGIQRNNSAFGAPAAPEGVQTAFLKSHDGRVSRSVALAPGVYRVSFMAARRANNSVNPVQVWVNNVAIGAPLTPPSTAFTRLVSADVTITTQGAHNIKLGTTVTGNNATFIDAVSVNAVNPFDALYPTNFLLKPLAADPILPQAKPASKASSLAVPSYTDRAYGTRVYRATAPSDFPSPSRYVRHDYSRRQAFNADNTRYIAHSENSFWLLYNADTFQVIPKGGVNGSLKDMGGQAEVIWHPTDPKKLWYTGNEGAGMVWWEKDVEADTRREIANFNDRVKARWPNATRVWTKGEGTSSADGRYLAFIADRYENSTLTIYGIFTWDSQTNTIVGWLDASRFGHRYPDHVSMSASGKFVVPSWAYAPTLGTMAYSRDFATSRQLNTESEHSDLALGPNGEDYYVVANEKSDHIRAINIANGAAFNIMRLYPRSRSAYAAHISGQAFDKPGWVLISTYADKVEANETTPEVRPDPQLEAPYRKIMLVELKENGAQYSVAHTQAAAGYPFGSDGYFGEHQATISRDGSRIMFATNFNDLGAPSSYMIGLPSWVFVGATGGTTPGDPGAGALKLTLGNVTHAAGSYSASFRITSSVAAKCRMASQPSTSYGAMHDNITPSADGKTHDKTTTFGSTGPQTVYVTCRSDSDGSETALTVNIP